MSTQSKTDWKAAAGSPLAHAIIGGNVLGELCQQLRGCECEAYGSDLRVFVPAEGLYAFPDATVVRGAPKFFDDAHYDIINPTVIVEVLSKSSEAYERGRKFKLYRSLESLSEYCLISSFEVHAEVFRRQSDGSWHPIARNKLEDSIELSSIGCRLNLAGLYEGLEFMRG